MSREAHKAFIEVVSGVATLCAMALLAVSAENPESIVYDMPPTVFWGIMFTGAVTAVFLLTEATADLGYAERAAERRDRTN